MRKSEVLNSLPPVLLILAAAFSAAGCGRIEGGSVAPAQDNNLLAPLALPSLEPVELSGRRLIVVATTNIIGDVVGHVGGGDIELVTLMGPGQDPHSYEPSARELAAVSEADVIFINGWGLEEGLARVLGSLSVSPIVPVSANITPLPLAGGAGFEGGRGDPVPDPHTWLDPHLVAQWTKNIDETLSALDPGHAAGFHQRAGEYQAALLELMTFLDEQIAAIPEEQRKLVTNHDSLGYFAAQYNFTVVGTVIPGASTLAEPSASRLADLVAKMQEVGVCTIFAESSAGDKVASAAAAELQGCDAVRVMTLYTGTLGPAGTTADSYIGMMRANVATIVDGLHDRRQ
ncbi:MAG: metal ABC transporter solute-binding protein, Zn/Mn family [Anaerolineae bacterium]